MALNVDPQQLTETAVTLAQLTREFHAGMPTGWVQAAGGDLGSVLAASYHNARFESATNDAISTLNRLAPHSHKIGASVADYTATDAEGGRRIGGDTGDVLANPLPEPDSYGYRMGPLPSAISSAPVDSLTFAQQLNGGPGPGPARSFADSVRQFLSGTHSSTLAGLDAAIPVLHEWTPVGTTAAAQLSGYRNQLDEIGTTLGGLASDVDSYAEAFETAKARHPTPQEIIAVRQRLLAAMRSKNSAALATALAQFNEQNARSAQTATEYSTKLSSTLQPTKAGGSGSQTTGGGSAGTGSMLSQMMPALMAALSGMNSATQQGNSIADDPTLDDSGYPFDGLPSVPSSSDIGGADPAVPSVDAGGLGTPADAVTPVAYQAATMPMVPTAAALTSNGLPRTNVVEPLQTSAGSGVAARSGSSPYMPYMPSAPGMQGGGAGGDRNRVVAWHPDRLMYVDDTPYTEAVIGEKPTIAPTVTPPTPAPANNYAPANSGGSV